MKEEIRFEKSSPLSIEEFSTSKELVNIVKESGLGDIKKGKG